MGGTPWKVGAQRLVAVLACTVTGISLVLREKPAKEFSFYLSFLINTGMWFYTGVLCLLVGSLKDSALVEFIYLVIYNLIPLM